MNIEDLIYAKERHMDMLMRTRLVELDISVRTLNKLDEAGIRTIGDLVNAGAEKVKNIPYIGTVAYIEISSQMKLIGIELK